MKDESRNLLYKSATVYKLIMRLLYGRHYGTRCTRIAELIPANSTVLDLCCGPAVLYHQHLRHKSVHYTGIDVSSQFVDALTKQGIPAILCDLRSNTALPHADYVVMQASLYHFLPNASHILDRMLHAARKQVIVAEPIRNLATSQIPILSTIAGRLSGPVVEASAQRFTEEGLDRFFRSYSTKVIQSFTIAGGREKVYVLDKSAA
jgi:trans-aconitate methyltransferase